MFDLPKVKVKHHKRRVLFQSFEIPECKWEHIAMDFFIDILDVGSSMSPFG